MLTAIESRPQWLKLRAANVGASDVASLFGCGFRTHFELWHEKHGTLSPEDLADDERVILGACLQDGIAAAAAQIYGLKLIKADYYLTDDDCPGLGASLDYTSIEDDGAAIPCEIKNASWGQWRDNWITHEDGTVEPPLRYLLQVQAQIACAGAERGELIALISGDRLVRCPIDRHEAAIKDIRTRVQAFWTSIRDHEPPPASMPEDFSAAKIVWSAGEGAADLSGDPDIEGWLQQLGNLRTDRKRLEDAINGIEGEILNYCVSNKFATVRANAGRISCKQKKATKAHKVQFRAQPAKIALRVTT